MNTIIVSDDLSGAAGMASMLGIGIPVIPFNKISTLLNFNSKIISLDIETRNRTDAVERLSIVKKTAPNARILVRIDTLLRGSSSDFIKFMAGYGKLLVTDTVPDYGRVTCNGKSIYKNDVLNIDEFVPEEIREIIKISDSRTYDDIQNLAKFCIDKNYLPVDPGIMIKMYLEMI